MTIFQQACKRQCLASLAGIVLLLAAGTATANGYFAIEGSALTLEEDDANSNSPAGLRLRLGTPLNRLIDVEGHFGFSFQDDKDDLLETSANYYGLYVKAHLPIGHYSSLFALAGMSTVNLTQEIRDTELKDTRSGGSFGFGMETRLTENADLTADYMSYLRDDGAFKEVSSFNFGIKLYF